MGRKGPALDAHRGLRFSLIPRAHVASTSFTICDNVILNEVKNLSCPSQRTNLPSSLKAYRTGGSLKRSTHFSGHKLGDGLYLKS